MKNEPIKIIGLILFFLIMGVMVGYNIRTSQEKCASFRDTEGEIEFHDHTEPKPF